MRKRHTPAHGSGSGGGSGTILPLHTGGGTNVPGRATPLVRRKKKKKKSSSNCAGAVVLFCISFVFMFCAVFGILHHRSPELRRHVKRHVKKLKARAKDLQSQIRGRGGSTTTDTTNNNIIFRPEDAGKRLNQKMPRPPARVSQSMTCPDGRRGLINDDYCDCSDGSDEPLTAACSMKTVQRATFRCKDGSRTIYSSRVGDGVKDCDDSSDEDRKKKI